MKANRRPEEVDIRNFSYDLPDEKIARFPLEQRDASKLLIYSNHVIESSVYNKLENHLPADSLLIFNDTKVVEARLLFKKESGGQIEIFCLEPAEMYADITSAMLTKGEVFWKCLVGGAKKWRAGFLEKEVLFREQQIVIQAEKIEQRNDYFIIRFTWNEKERSFAEILHLAGIIPLPPYLKRVAEESDQVRYQTVYANMEGSVAAPTAGLHFTEDLLKKIEAKGIQKKFVTLHVGAGTFKPVTSEKLQDHEMHAEFIDVSLEFISSLINHAGPIIPVGTTSLRTIETLYWMGVKAAKLSSADIAALSIQQWDAYDWDDNAITKNDALLHLVEWMKRQNITRIICKTQLLIAPGYQLKVADAIITNFHQPQSTLLLLVHAFVGENWKHIYDYALKNNFRFLSYGDGSLLWKHSKGDV
jgi:S-adenosylmethionine:tRNA ribosyltransferase-isomerase